MAAIYQRARPHTFAQVVGQQHVTEVLQAALARGRTSHAYLFSGPRGVGKTTSARLLAMAVNCEAEDGDRPCGECESCRLVRNGSHPDVIELDAASNNSVEDVRELREKVGLAALRGGHRVWILDEAHMLSRAAANALLKTLEEPPPRLVFVLATTEPEKLPPTILSRCQHYRFRRLSEEEISGKLELLCREAGVEASPDALALVARAADGAMRDAESLLERLLTPGTPITLESVTEALGLPPRERMLELAQALAGADVAAAFDLAAGLYRDGFSPRSLAEHLTVALRDELIASLEGAPALDPPAGRDELLRVIHALDDEMERFTRRDDLYSLEVALVKAINALSRNAPAEAGAYPVPEPRAGSAAGPAPRAAAPAPEPPTAAAGREPGGADPLPDFDPFGRSAPEPRPARRAGDRAAPERAAAAAPAQAGTGPATATAANDAGGVKPPNLHALRSRANAQLRAFLMPAREEAEGRRLTISYGETHKFHYQQLLARQEELERLIAELAGPGVELVITGPGGSTRKKP